MKEGKLQALSQTAQRMRSMGMSDEQIVQALGLSAEEIHKIR